MGTINLTLPTSGVTPNATADPEIVAAFTTIQNAINGGIDASNFSAQLAQAAGVNQSGQTMKGAFNLLASDTRSNAAYGTLPNPDQITGIVLPANGLIWVWYQAVWQESVTGAARAAIFVGGTQLTASNGSNTPTNQETNLGGGTTSPNTYVPLASYGFGLNGSTLNQAGAGIGSNPMAVGAPGQSGGPCTILALAGTYTVSVQFKASSGSVTAAQRHLWVQAAAFA